MFGNSRRMLPAFLRGSSRGESEEDRSGWKTSSCGKAAFKELTGYPHAPDPGLSASGPAPTKDAPATTQRFRGKPLSLSLRRPVE
jgi:hypothetical protein